MIIISNKETYANVCQHYEEDINTFKDLKDDWDGEGSAEITENLITETMIFISKLVMIKFYDQTLYRLHLCLIIPLLFFSICHNNGFF